MFPRVRIAADRARRLEFVEAGHDDVHQDEVGLDLPRAFSIASSPLSLATTSSPTLVSISFSACLSVGESSTMRIFLIGHDCLPVSSVPRRFRVRGRAVAFYAAAARLTCEAHGLRRAFLGQWLGQVLVSGTHHPPPCAIKQAVLGRQHDHGNAVELRILLDQRAGLRTRRGAAFMMSTNMRSG